MYQICYCKRQTFTSTRLKCATFVPVNQYLIVPTAESMEKERLTKIADVRTVDGRKRRGSLRMRWEDCMKRCFGKLGSEWETRARDKRVETGLETAVKVDQ